jgi:DNA-directed RNA polymerase subunit RPC12/RpoP
VATVRCESCGAEQQANLLEGSDPVCENCGSRTLTQVGDETTPPTQDASAPDAETGVGSGTAAVETGDRQTATGVERDFDGSTRPDAVPFSPGTLFEVLADDRRRYVLYYLLEADGRGTLADLADQLAAREAETAVDALKERERKSVATDLHHVTVPRLADCGLVDFDPETGKVTATERLRQAEPFLDFARTTEPAAHERFLDQLTGGASTDSER